MNNGQDRDPVQDEMVYVVDDDEGVRRALCRLLGSADIRAAGFPSVEAFLEQPFSSQPSCLVLDVNLGDGRSGLDLQAELGDREATVPIVFVTGAADVQMSVHAMKAGAVDVLEKPVDDDALLSSVHSALALSRQRVRVHAQRTAIVRRFEQLTPRERQLLWLVVRGGLSNRQMAAEMDAAEKTIKVHRGRLMQKMHANSVPDLVLMTDLLPQHARADTGPKRRSRR